MSDQFAVATRLGSDGVSMEFYDKASGAVLFALRGSSVVDMSGAQSLLMPNAVPPSFATVTLTAAQIRALHGTPIQLLAAQGAGTLIQVTEILYEFTYGSVAFATSSGVLNVFWGAGGTAAGTNGLAAAILTGTAPLLVGDTPEFPGNTSGITPATLTNKALVVQNPSATEYTGGTGSSLLVRVGYRIISGL